MTISFNLTVFGWHISTFDIDIDIDQRAHACQPLVDRPVKRITRWWTERMSS